MAQPQAVPIMHTKIHRRKHNNTKSALNREADYFHFDDFNSHHSKNAENFSRLVFFIHLIISSRLWVFEWNTRASQKQRLCRRSRAHIVKQLTKDFVGFEPFDVHVNSHFWSHVFFYFIIRSLTCGDLAWKWKQCKLKISLIIFIARAHWQFLAESNITAAQSLCINFFSFLRDD